MVENFLANDGFIEYHNGKSEILQEETRII